MLFYTGVEHGLSRQVKRYTEGVREQGMMKISGPKGKEN
jgi:hypothetical protein